MVVALSQKSNNPKISKKMVEEILKRKSETIEKLKEQRSIKEAILETKKAGKRPLIAEAFYQRNKCHISRSEYERAIFIVSLF